MAEIHMFIVRHGETDANVTLTVDGQADSQLTDVGRRQAAAAGEALSGVTFDAVLSSDLARTLETADCVLKVNNYEGPISKIPQLRERGYGDFEGRSVYDLVTVPGWQWVIETFNPEGYQLESPDDFTTRIKKWFKDFLSDARRGANVSKTRLNYLIVTHGYVKGVLVRHLMERGCRLPEGKTKDDVKRGPPNSSITKIRFRLSAGSDDIEDIQCLELFSKAHLDGKEGLKDGVPYNRDQVIQKMKAIYAQAKQEKK